MNLIAVDPSMEAAGVAVWDVVQEKVLMHDTLRQAGTDSERLLSLGSRLKRIVNEYAPDALVVETPSSLYVKRDRSQTALKVLLAVGATVGAIGNAVSSCGMVGVQDWRGTRKSMPKNVALRVAHVWAPECRTDHEAEAVCIGAYFVNPFGLQAALTLAAYEKSRAEIEAAWEKYRHHHAPGALLEAVSKADTRAFLRANLKGGRRGRMA